MSTTPITDKYGVDHIGFYTCATVPANICAGLEETNGKLRAALSASMNKLDDLAAKLAALRDTLPTESPLLKLTAFEYQEVYKQGLAAIQPEAAT